MLKLKKGHLPQTLKDNSAQWTSNLLGCIASKVKIPPTLANSYNQVDVKEALRIESKEKCMYCESPISHISYEHIEHIKPKSKYPELTFDWNNLGLSCPKCNMNKGDIYDSTAPFLNPYIDNPDEYIYFYGTYVFHRNSNIRAETTIKVIQLNRPELHERRRERIQLIKALIDRHNALPDSILKVALHREIMIEIQNDKPYSFCTKFLVDGCINT